MESETEIKPNKIFQVIVPSNDINIKGFLKNEKNTIYNSNDISFHVDEIMNSLKIKKRSHKLMTK